MINRLLITMMYIFTFTIIPILTILPTTASAEKLSSIDRNKNIPQHVQTPSQTGSEAKTIVPGVGVGDFTLGMSKDDVLKKLGKPEVIYRGHEYYTLDNLPREYRLHFDGIEFEINNNTVEDIRAQNSSYALSNGLTVGDSIDRVKQAFGADFDGKGNYFHYYNKGIGFEFHEEEKTVYEIRVFKPEPEDDDDDESDSRGDFKLDVYEGDLKVYEDVDDMDLRACDLRSSGDILNTLTFSQKTLWPPAERLPEGFDPQALLEEGMNPGLGVRSLHAKGITGAGVHVGLIDQPLLVDHPEYAGKIVSYHHPDFESDDSSMHCPAMASLLVGERCGTAPGAKLHVIAVPSWNRDAGCYARALDRFVEYNQKVPSKDKIRVVSVSCQPSGEGSVFNNPSLWDEAVERAQAQGILVLDCTWHHGFVSLCWLDPQNRESVEACTPGFRRGTVEVDKGHIHVPAKPRTWAKADDDSDQPFDYTYEGGGRRSRWPKAKNGYSPTIPYAAGVLAMGWQIHPELTPAQMKALLFASAHVHESGAKIINPTAFIESVRKQRGNSVSGGVCSEDSETQTIVPGVGIGDFILGMSKDEVLKRLGKPKLIYYGGKRYTLNNLPKRSEYRLHFGHIEFHIHKNSVREIMAKSPLYAFENGLTVGDSMDKVKQTFGTDFKGSGNVFRYSAKGLRFEFHDEERTVNEIRIFRPEPKDDDDENANDAPDQAEHKQNDRSTSEVDDSDFKAYMNAPGKQVCLDLREKDLRACDLRFAADILDNLIFDHETVWPPPHRLPEGFDPKILLEESMNPGLGIRSLHAQGITGAGVHVGLIDQPLFLDHPEYAGKIVSYHAPGFEPQRSSSHGTGMASILVGKRCGTAPGACLHAVAIPMWEHDAGHAARALDRFFEYNQKAPQKDKIRVISVSCQPSGEGSNFKNQSQWDEAVERAQAQGILVLDGAYGPVSLCWMDPKDRENVEACTPGFRNSPVEVDEGHIHVPTAPLTSAEDVRPSGYIYFGGYRRISPGNKGGYSAAFPYAAGVLALGWQIRPELTPAQLMELLFASAHVHESGAKIIHPTAFIESVRKQRGNSVSGGVCNEDSETQTIVPGVGIGDFTLGMSKDEVLKKLGGPEVIGFAGKRYSLDNLPRRYRMSFDDMSFAMVDDVVTGITVRSPSYILANDLRVGDSKEKIIETFNDDELEYDDKGVLVRVDEKNGTVREITIYPTRRDDEQEDEGQDDPGEGFDPDALLEAGKNPGLGVRALHAQGITGASVHVGLIDMSLNLGHPEYAGKIVSYNHAGDPNDSSMHGPYVVSLLVGKHCGTAPGAKLHVEALDLAEHDAGHCARALDRFVTYNEGASKDQRIRIVSVSACPSGEGSLYKNQSLWDESVQRAEARGILVLDCTWHHGFVSICWLDPKDRENVEACTPGFRYGPVEVDEGHIHVPRAPRTTARAPSDGPFGYSYSDGGRRRKRPYSKSGYSPTIPYAAGVLAMGWQIRPELTPAQMKELLFASAHVHESGAKIINPTAFIESVRKQKGNPVSGGVCNEDSDTRTIVPGERIGEITLGMRKDDVLKRLGKPKVIYYGDNRYTLDKLPKRFGMFFGDISVFIEDDGVQRIDAHSSSFALANGLRVGDSEEKIKKALGNDFELLEYGEGASLTYEGKGVRFEIDGNSRIIEEIQVFLSEDEDDDDEDDAPNSDNIAGYRNPLPGPLVFPKIDRRPQPDSDNRLEEMKSLPKHISGSHDVAGLRGRDLSKLDLRDSFEDLMYIEFDSRTIWPASDKLPSGFDPEEIMEIGKNPGLGLRSLHKQGITGRGVRIAILDQPLLVDHREYADRLQLYEEIHIATDGHSQSHGCMTASVAVGKTVGVAPEAELFFIGQYNFDRGGSTFQYLAQGIHRIVEINEQLPQDKKIRAISISRGWTRNNLFDKRYSMIADAVQKARAAGMLVVTCSVDMVHEGCDYAGLGRPPLTDPDVFESYRPNLWAAESFWAGRYQPNKDSSKSVFFVPLDSRTMASEDGVDEYTFDRCGGFSKAPPFTAGVYALAVQVDPSITPERFWALATKTGRTIEVERNGKKRRLGPIIDPVALIRSIKAGELSHLNRIKSDNQKSEQLSDDGFISMFDGKTLSGWHAVPQDSASDWTIRDGVIVGRGSANRQIYLVWKDQQLTDFELRFRYRLLTRGNTGVELRSRPDLSGKRPFEGYHADLGHVGIGPHILGAWDFHFARRKEYPCPRGTRLVIDEDGKTQSYKIHGALKAADVRQRQWNDVHVIVRGNHFRFFINGKPASEFTDNAEHGRLTRGAIGLQLHDKGMHVEFKDLYLRCLTTD